MKLKINGETHEFERELSLRDLVERFELNPLHVAVELNRQIVKRGEYPQTTLKEGDVIEIVHFVGGG